MQRTSCLKEFVKYASLHVLGMLGLSCYILADTFFISMGLGADGLTALNLAIPVYSFIHGSGLMLGIGGGTKYSIQKSLGGSQKADSIFTCAFWHAILTAVLFLLLGVCFCSQLVSLLGAGERVFQMTKTYVQMILVCSPAFLMNNLFLCFVRNDGAPQLSMAAMLAGSFSNIVLDYVFIFPCNLGIFGAVLATCLAPVISMAVLSLHFIQKNNGFCLAKYPWGSRQISGILLSGFPSFLTEVSSGIVIIVFNLIILKIQGNTGVAAYGVIANLSLVILSVFTGIAQGIQPIASKYYGMGNPRQAKAILRYALITMLGLSVLIYTGIFFGAEAITRAFNSGQDAVLQRIAEHGMKLYFTACPFAGANIILSMYFTTTERPLPANLISILRGIAVILPLAFLLSALAQMVGIWCAFPCTELLVSLVSVSFFTLQDVLKRRPTS